MKQQELISLIKNPSVATASDLDKLMELKKQFPFFQSAHLLLSLVAKRYDTGLYQQTLRQTAISIPDRAQLHKLLFKSNVVELTTLPPTEVTVKTDEVVEKSLEKTEIVNEELNHLKAIELSSEPSSEQKLTEAVEMHLKKDVVNAFVEKEILKTNEWYKKDKPQNEQENKPVSKIQETKKPLTSGSFADWLKELKREEDIPEQTIQDSKKEIQETETGSDPKTNNESQEKKSERKLKQQAIIDKIIEVDPSKIRLDPNQRFFAADVKAKESLFENEELVTETLAKIYAIQGNINKAIRAYEILSLKFPQKSAYFATLIQDLKKQNT